MEEQITSQTAGEHTQFELGSALGQKKAFSLIAGRCTAAEAAVIRRIREEDLYRPSGLPWSSFCPRYLGMSRTQADRTIRHLDEFGPEFFELTQLTRIPPEAYRTISFAVREGKIFYRGEGIPLIAQNTERVNLVVAALRTQYGSRARVEEPAKSRPDPLQKACLQAAAMLEDWQKLAADKHLGRSDLDRIADILAALRIELQELENKIRGN